MSSDKLKNQIQIKLESRIEGVLREFHGEIDKKVKKAIIAASKDLSKKLVKSIEKASKNAVSSVIIINKTDKKLPIPALATDIVPPTKVIKRRPRTAASASKSVDLSAAKPKIATVRNPKTVSVSDTPVKRGRKKAVPNQTPATSNTETAAVKSSTPRASRKKNS